MKKNFYTLLFIVALSSMAAAQKDEGSATYTIQQSVIAGGGAYSQWTQPTVSGKDTLVSNYEVTGTIGQPAVGRTSNGSYQLDAGFWWPDLFQPTAAPASISGHVNNLQSVGSLARRIRIVVTNMSTGEIHSQPLGPFGYYEFPELALATFYTIKAEGPSMVFEPESMTFRLLDNVTDVDFTVMPIQQ